MGERFWVTLKIGGDCTPEVRDELARCIEAEGPEEGFDPDEEDLTGPDNNSVISLQFAEVNYGDLDELEPFLKQHRLPYHKVIYGNSGDNTIMLWPLFDENIMDSCYCNTDHIPLIDGQKLLKMLLDPLVFISDIAEFVYKQLPPILPPFRVIPKEEPCNPCSQNTDLPSGQS